MVKGAKLIASDVDSRENYSQSVIVFTDKAIAAKADGITRFLKAYNKAVATINTNPNSFRDVLVEKAGLPKDIQESYQVIPWSLAQSPKPANLEAVVQWLRDKQVITARPTYAELVNTSVLPR